MKSDLVIIGGGIIGLYSAYLLAQHDINITLVDKGDFGQESSSVAGGILAPLLPWHYNKEVTLLTSNASDDYYNLSKRLFELSNIDIEYWKCGLTVLENCENNIKQWCSDHNVALLQDNSHDLNHFHLPDISQVRMPLVIKALIKMLQLNNVTLLDNTSVDNLNVNKNRVSSVSTSRGNIHTNKVLLASGAWISEIQNFIPDLRIPTITPIKGQMIAIQTTPGLLNKIIFKNGHYLIPRKDGLIIAGSTLENVGYDKQLTEEARDELWQNSLTMLPELSNYAISHHWAGLRPGSANNIPTIGPHPDIEGLYLNCGHFRYGVAMAPKSAEIMGHWILNNGKKLNEDEQFYSKGGFA